MAPDGVESRAKFVESWRRLIPSRFDRKEDPLPDVSVRPATHLVCWPMASRRAVRRTLLIKAPGSPWAESASPTRLFKAEPPATRQTTVRSAHGDRGRSNTEQRGGQEAPLRPAQAEEGGESRRSGPAVAAHPPQLSLCGRSSGGSDFAALVSIYTHLPPRTQGSRQR